MKYNYTKENIKEWLNENLDMLLSSPAFQALIVELKISDDLSNELELISNPPKIETRFTNTIKSDRTLRVNRAGNDRKGSFDYLRIIDGVSHRIFQIPHDLYFERAKTYPNGEFIWSASYNKTDNKQTKNTKLLLEHEVIA